MFSPLLLQSRRWKCQSKQRLLRVNQSIWRLQNSILKTGPHSCLHPSPVSVLGWGNSSWLCWNVFGRVTAQVQGSGFCFISCASHGSSLELFLKRLSCLPHQTTSLVDSSQAGFYTRILCLTSFSLSPEGFMLPVRFAGDLWEGWDPSLLFSSLQTASLDKRPFSLLCCAWVTRSVSLLQVNFIGSPWICSEFANRICSSWQPYLSSSIRCGTGYCHRFETGFPGDGLQVQIPNLNFPSQPLTALPLLWSAKAGGNLPFQAGCWDGRQGVRSSAISAVWLDDLACTVQEKAFPFVQQVPCMGCSW